MSLRRVLAGDDDDRTDGDLTDRLATIGSVTDVFHREAAPAALARLYDLDLSDDPGDVELYRAMARRTGDPVIELAVGTGRVATALAEDGHRVVGVDNDAAM